MWTKKGVALQPSTYIHKTNIFFKNKARRRSDASGIKFINAGKEARNQTGARSHLHRNPQFYPRGASDVRVCATQSPVLSFCCQRARSAKTHPTKPSPTSLATNVAAAHPTERRQTCCRYATIRDCCHSTRPYRPAKS